jgi:hypothetical protein
LTNETNKILFDEYINSPLHERESNIKFTGIETLKSDFNIKTDELLIEMYP